MSDPEPNRRILASSTLTRNYQVTIPKPVRERFRFEEGDLVVFILEEGRLLIERG